MFIDSKLINKLKKDRDLSCLRTKRLLGSSRFVNSFIELVYFLHLCQSFFLCPIGSSCCVYCCLGNWRFRYLLASILLVDLDLQMVRHVLIRVGHARTHGSQDTPLW